MHNSLNFMPTKGRRRGGNWIIESGDNYHDKIYPPTNLWHNFVFAAFGNCRIRDKDESDVQKLCEDIDHCLILAASIAVMASAERHCSKERRHPHKQVCTLGCFARNVIQNCLGVLTIYFWFKLKQIPVLFSLLWAAGAWSMNMESSWECWMPPINGLKGFCCCNCRMYSWWGGH